MIDRSDSATLMYHNDTKHSFHSVHSNSHYLDFSNQPMPFKVYPEIEPIALPPEPTRAIKSDLKSIFSLGEEEGGQKPLSLEILARLFFLTSGITKSIEVGGRSHYFRAAACTGALYHIELYLICGDLLSGNKNGLAPGVYHLAVQDYAARCLRLGDYRATIAESLGRSEVPEAVFVYTSTYWRNAWKYQSRTYRHCFWDSGTMLANCLAVAASYDVDVRLNAGFKDNMVNELLGLDIRDEVSLAVMELGERNPIQDGAGKIKPVDFKIAPLSAAPIDYPEIREIHDASSLRRGSEVLDWRLNAESFRNEKFQKSTESESSLREKGYQLFSLIEGEHSGDSIDDVILRRGSARRFGRLSIKFEDLSVILKLATRTIPADFLPSGLPILNEIYLIVSAVDGLPSGAYFFDRHLDTLVLLREGNFRREAGVLGLDQDLAADASVNVYFLSDLGKVLCAFGDRGYRAAQLEAGVLGGKLYLGAYAQRLAASGLTFYDDEVISFFGPHAKGKEVMFLVLLGRRNITRPRS